MIKESEEKRKSFTEIIKRLLIRIKRMKRAISIHFMYLIFRGRSSSRLETIELLNNSFEADFSQTSKLLITIEKISKTEEVRTRTVTNILLETICE